MARKKAKAGEALFDVRTLTAPCVPALREKLLEWRGVDIRDSRPDWPRGGYKGATETTCSLLRHWFYTDHRLANGRKFRYGYFQQEAVETLIEVARVRSQKGADRDLPAC